MIIKKTKNKAILLITATALVIPSFACAKNSSEFLDLDKDAWYKEAVEYVLENDIFMGTSETTFSPDEPMTRGMFVTVLGRNFNDDLSEYENKSSYNDISKDDYFSKYAEWAKDNEVMIGTGENKFNPQENITRQDAVKALFNYYSTKYDLKENKFSSYKNDNIVDYLDIADYAQSSFNWALELNIIRGFDSAGGAIITEIVPKKEITRAEMAQIMKRLDDYEKFMSDKEIMSLDTSEIKSIDIKYDPGFPDSIEKNFSVTDHKEIEKIISDFKKEEKEKGIKETEKIDLGAITGGPRAIMTLHTKSDTKLRILIYGEDNDSVGAIVKENISFVFYEPLSLDY